MQLARHAWHAGCVLPISHIPLKLFMAMWDSKMKPNFNSWSIKFVIPCVSLAYMETSAATGQNVAKAVELLVDMVMRRMDHTLEQTMLRGSSRGLPRPGQDLGDWSSVTSDSSRCSSCWERSQNPHLEGSIWYNSTRALVPLENI